MTIDYNLSEKDQQEVENISKKIATRMDAMYYEKAQQEKISTVLATYRIMKELSEVHLCKELLAASKRMGEKLKTN